MMKMSNTMEFCRSGVALDEVDAVNCSPSGSNDRHDFPWEACNVGAVPQDFDGVQAPRRASISGVQIPQCQDRRLEMNAVPMVEARSVSRSFSADGKEIPVLHGVSLQIMPGEMVAIMGPSGSGKSTLMYCLAGLDQPTSGQVSLKGTDLASRSRKALAEMRRGELGFVFQSYNLVPTLTAYENVALPYLLSGKKPPREQLIEVMNEVGLGHRIDAKVPSMSGGEQQRTALARVLAQQPQVVFADEPTGALDSRSGELVMARLAGIARQAGRSVVVVTHDPGVAARCDRVIFLFDGQLAGELRPQNASQVANILTELAERTRA